MSKKIESESRRLDHLGLVAQMANEISLVDTLDSLAGVDSREIITFGQSVLAMAINGLGYTSRPLYMTPDFYIPRDMKFLLGESKNHKDLELLPEHLNDDKLGRTLDKIAEIGPDKVFLTLAVQAFRKEGP